MEERNIKLTLEKAREFYAKGGEFKDLALSVFTEKELTKKILPKTWSEFCDNYPTKDGERYIDEYCAIGTVIKDMRRSYNKDRNILPSFEASEAHLALMQLHQLRDCYRQGWKPNFNDKNDKYCIKLKEDYVYLYTSVETSYFLSFQKKELALEFMDNFRNIIIQAGDLI